ncbi:hypothetical protein D9758_006481 [Tetrapyrgos nigripes]|uniref:Uncharacterized protein n=1 Tax=Tetrapyrgos nigripes TaxID=182062 RepID=A0A8H5GKU1_9AGAR|nr:hypothetical protein D9758_006481 [Tetrapyrgos nigripes]
MRQSDDIPAQSRTSSKAKRRSKPRGSYTDRDIGDAFESAKAELIKLADLSPAFDQDDRKTYNKLHADFQAVRTRYQSLDFDEAEGSQQHFLRRLLFWRSTPKNVDFNKLVYELDGLRAWIITASADVETKLHRKNQTSLGDAFQSLTQRMLQEFDDKAGFYIPLNFRTSR